MIKSTLVKQIFLLLSWDLECFFVKKKNTLYFLCSISECMKTIKLTLNEKLYTFRNYKLFGTIQKAVFLNLLNLDSSLLFFSFLLILVNLYLHSLFTTSKHKCKQSLNTSSK